MRFSTLLLIIFCALRPFANANSIEETKDCQRWLMGMAKTMSNGDRKKDLTKNHEGSEVDSAHDLEVNDPSVAATELVTDEYYEQNWLAVTGVNSHINENIRESFKGILAEEPAQTEEVLNKEKSKKLLGLHSARYQPLAENGPTTVNSNTEYCGISDRSHGYCWGYATLVRNFHTLAFYNERLPKLKISAEYLKRIDLILSGKAVLFPGYKNFRELSMVPEFELYLKLNAMELWKTRAVRLSSLSIFRNATDAMTLDAQASLLDDLQKRLDRNEMPKIVFSSLIPSATILGMNTDIHVVLVNGIEKLANGHTRIYIWDINFYAETLLKSPKFIEITTDHQLHYAPWYDPKVSYAKQSDLIANIQIAPENDAETIGMIRSLKSFCKKHPQYCKASL